MKEPFPIATQKHHHQITQAFINKGLFSSTSNFQYKMHCLQIIHQSCEMQYVNTASFLATKLERMEESWSYLYFCAHFNPLIILLVRRNHLSVRNRLQLNLGQRYFPKNPRVTIFLLTWGTLLLIRALGTWISCYYCMERVYVELLYVLFVSLFNLFHCLIK
jgi:hypothetical protein